MVARYSDSSAGGYWVFLPPQYNSYYHNCRSIAGENSYRVAKIRDLRVLEPFKMRTGCCVAFELKLTCRKLVEMGYDQTSGAPGLCSLFCIHYLGILHLGMLCRVEIGPHKS